MAIASTSCCLTGDRRRLPGPRWPAASRRCRRRRRARGLRSGGGAARSGRGLWNLRLYMSGPVAAPDLQHVAETGGRHQRGLHAAPLGDGVDDDGRAVDEGDHRRRIDLRQRGWRASTPSAKLAGVVEAFAAQTRPDASSKATTSVKVPPMSTASADPRLRRRSPSPCHTGPSALLARAVQMTDVDAIDLTSDLGGDVPIAHVVEDQVTLAFVGITPAAAVAGDDADEIAAASGRLVTRPPRITLAVAAHDLEEVARSLLTTGNAPGPLHGAAERGEQEAAAVGLRTRNSRMVPNPPRRRPAPPPAATLSALRSMARGKACSMTSAG